MRRHNDTIAIDYTWEPEDDTGCTYELEITGTVESYDPGDYDTPPSGGCVVDLSVILFRVSDENNVPRMFTNTEKGKIEAAFTKALDTDAAFLERIEAIIGEAYNARREPDDSSDELYERSFEQCP